MDGFALGKTKVFMKYYHLEYLSKLYEKEIRKIIRVQVQQITSLFSPMHSMTSRLVALLQSVPTTLAPLHCTWLVF
jgi:hypothetical protein